MDIHKYLCEWNLSDDFIERIETFAVWRNGYARDAIFVTKTHEVYAGGDIIELCCEEASINISNPNVDVYEPVKLSALCGKRIKKFIIGIGEVFICTEEGDVFGYGYRYGHDKIPSKYVFPEKVSQLQGLCVIDIAIGRGESLALCDNGELYSFKFGVLIRRLVNINVTHYAKPLNIFYTSEDCYISLMENGRVMKLIYEHDNEYCPLSGVFENNMRNHAEVIGFQKAIDHGKIEKIACSSSHVLALDEYGRLFVAGSNSCGRLGLDKDEKYHGDKFERNSFFTEKIIDIAVSGGLSAALTVSGKVYMWGFGRCESIFIPKLTPLESFHEVFFYYGTYLTTYKPITVHELSSVTSNSVKTLDIATSKIKQIERPLSDAQNVLIDAFKKAFDDPKFCDLFIVVEGKTIPVHRSILSLRCEHFAEIFQKSLPIENPSVLEIEDGDFKVYKALLKFLYTDEIDDTLSFNEITELLNLANKYNVEQLAECCVRLIQSDITAENVVSLYERVHVMSKATKMKNVFDQLQKFCVKFTVDNDTAIVLSDEFAKLNGEMAKEFIVEVFKYKSNSKN
ncbi:RCC1 and BTB domain-containing protein 1-like [Planococcus citri]|uniref:RCC1 and BTB domain-containing protein 1-like n=1 Tax=Planococcus citri TaxID=170843 RepID=UPI0031F940DA